MTNVYRSCSSTVNRARGGEGAGGLQPPHFFGNFKELLRKRCFQLPHFESLFSPPTFKVAPRALVNQAPIFADLLNDLSTQLKHFDNSNRIKIDLPNQGIGS